MKKLLMILPFILCACDSDTVKINDTEIRITKAVTREEQAKGLMFQKEMCENCGMLFYFVPQYISMWMKNTYLPLDMIFADSKGKILCIAKDTTPLSEKSITCDKEARYVLEVNANFCDKHNIKVGDIIKI